MLALVFAAALALLGYAMIASQAAPPQRSAHTIPDVAPPPLIDEVADLPPARRPPAIAEASYSTRILPRPSGPATARITGDASGLGLGVLDGESGALLAWHPLADAELPIDLPLGDFPEGRHWLIAARDRQSLGHFYVTRVPLEMTWHGDALTGSAEIELAPHRVLVRLDFGAAEELPLVRPKLRRDDDPAWSHRPTTGTADAAVPMVFEGLGVGDYRLELDGARVDPEDVAKLAFNVPDVTEVVIRCHWR